MLVAKVQELAWTLQLSVAMPKLPWEKPVLAGIVNRHSIRRRITITAKKKDVLTVNTAVNSLVTLATTNYQHHNTNGQLPWHVPRLSAWQLSTPTA